MQAQVGQGDVRGFWVRGQPSPLRRSDDERDRVRGPRDRDARRACRTRAYPLVTPAGPEDVPVEFVSALRSLRAGDRPPRGDPRRGARVRPGSPPSPRRSPPRSARPAGRSPPPSSRPAGSSSCTTPPARRPGTARSGWSPWSARRSRPRSAPTRCSPRWRGPGSPTRSQESGLDPHAAGGTVTRVLSQSFGALERRSEQTELEIRASWTAADEDLGRHLRPGRTLLCTAAGLRTTARRRRRLRATALIAGSGPAHRIRLKSRVTVPMTGT